MNTSLKFLKSWLIYILRSTAKQLARNHPIILMYHRVLPEKTSYSMSLALFRQQMKILKNNFNIVPLKELINNANGKNKKNSIAITFDDGYQDFYSYVLPVLKEFEIPATLFVTTGFVNGDFWLWPDKLRYLLENTEKDELFIKQFDSNLKLDQGWEEAWHVISNYCVNKTKEDRDIIIQDLQDLLEIKLPIEVPEKFKGVTWSQIKEIADVGMEIGSHTVSHEILSHLPLTSVVKELVDSKKILDIKLNKKVKGFCYPNGLQEDINSEVKKKIKQAGYDYAVAAYPSRKPLGDLMEINRYPASSNMYNFKNTIYGLRYQALIKASFIRRFF